MLYLALKYLHVLCVGATGAGFVWRGWLMLRGDPRLSRGRYRILPHVVDTLLLGSAVAMLAVARINPLDVAWLSVKLVALVVYIGLGFVALRLGRTRAQRAGAWVLALGVFAFMLAVALTKTPLPFVTV